MKPICAIPAFAALQTFFFLSAAAQGAGYCNGLYVEAETQTAPQHRERIRAVTAGRPLVVDRLSPSPVIETHSGETDAFTFLGDLHGSWPAFGVMLSSLDFLRPQYLALELPEDPTEKQTWDRFNELPIGSTGFNQAAKKAKGLLQSWDQRYTTWASPYNQASRANWNRAPLFELVSIAKQRGIKIIPIDARDCYRLAAPVGHRSVLVRNHVWARNLFQLKGRILVFGGRPHFSAPFQDNVQDYLQAFRRQAAMRPAEISFLEPRSPEELAFEKDFVRRSYTDEGY